MQPLRDAFSRLAFSSKRLQSCTEGGYQPIELNDCVVYSCTDRLPDIDVHAELIHVAQELARKQTFHFRTKWSCVAFLSGSSSPEMQYEVS